MLQLFGTHTHTQPSGLAVREAAEQRHEVRPIKEAHTAILTTNVELKAVEWMRIDK